jgi:hexosaminidase
VVGDLVTVADIEFTAFAREPASAELGWSPKSTHDRPGPRFNVLGISYYHSTRVPWPACS